MGLDAEQEAAVGPGEGGGEALPPTGEPVKRKLLRATANMRILRPTRPLSISKRPSPKQRRK